MRQPLNPKEIEKVISHSPDLAAFTSIGKDGDLPDNGGVYKFDVNAAYTGDQHSVRVEVCVTTGIEKLRLVRVLQNETRVNGIQEIKQFCHDANKYFVASMFTSFPAPDEQFGLFDDLEG